MLLTTIYNRLPLPFYLSKRFGTKSSSPERTKEAVAYEYRKLFPEAHITGRKNRRPTTIGRQYRYLIYPPPPFFNPFLPMNFRGDFSRLGYCPQLREYKCMCDEVGMKLAEEKTRMNQRVEGGGGRSGESGGGRLWKSTERGGREAVCVSTIEVTEIA